MLLRQRTIAGGDKPRRYDFLEGHSAAAFDIAAAPLEKQRDTSTSRSHPALAGDFYKAAIKNSKKIT